jgi:integrase
MSVFVEDFVSVSNPELKTKKFTIKSSVEGLEASVIGYAAAITNLTVPDKDGNYEQAKISVLNSYAQTCSRMLGIPFYFHSLRHMLTTLMAGKYHIPSKVIQEYFGWSSTALVDIYDDTEVADTFGDYFSKDGIKECKQGSLSSI